MWLLCPHCYTDLLMLLTVCFIPLLFRFHWRLAAEITLLVDLLVLDTQHVSSASGDNNLARNPRATNGRLVRAGSAESLISNSNHVYDRVMFATRMYLDLRTHHF